MHFDGNQIIAAICSIYVWLDTVFYIRLGTLEMSVFDLLLSELLAEYLISIVIHPLHEVDIYPDKFGGD